MGQPARTRPVTYDDLRRVPDHLVAEILDGDLFATPRPSLLHARAGGALGVEIGGPFDQGRGGPGGGSGASLTNGVRISFGPLVRDTAKIDEGLDRLGRWMRA